MAAHSCGRSGKPIRASAATPIPTAADTGRVARQRCLPRRQRRVLCPWTIPSRPALPGHALPFGGWPWPWPLDRRCPAPETTRALESHRERRGLSTAGGRGERWAPPTTETQSSTFADRPFPACAEYLRSAFRPTACGRLANAVLPREADESAVPRKANR